MIGAVLRDQKFLADVQTRAAGFHLWWLGQSGFLLKHGTSCLLCDPYLSDSLTAKYANTNKPHVRMTERVVDPADLDFIQVVTSSHNHTDHLDAATLRPLMAANPGLQLVIPEANRGFVAERLGSDAQWPVGLDAGQSADAAGFRITAVPAAHEELCRSTLGYVIEAAGVRIYHAGDTIRYAGMAERLRNISIDIALLPINGRDPKRGVAGNLSGKEAAELAHDMGASLAIPMHYDMFAFNTESPSQFTDECMRLDQRFRILRAGERLDWPVD